MAFSQATQVWSESTRVDVIPASICLLLAIAGALYGLYERVLLPQPLAGIPYDKKSARKVLGDGPDMVKEVGATREIHIWLLKKVNQFQVPLSQVFIHPLSRPWVLLADSVEAQNLLTRRPEFDRSAHDRAGLSPLDGFHSRHAMGSDWQRTRSWLQDLTSPRFIKDIFSPVIYANSFQLVEYWRKKADLAKDRPFDVNRDLDHVAIDGMFSLMFDEEYEHAALGPQLEYLKSLASTDVGTGSKGEALFPQAPFNPFAEAMYLTVDMVNYVTSCIFPRLGQYWCRFIPRFSKAVAVRRQVIKEQVQRATKRLADNKKPVSAIELMLDRERRLAEKQGRRPDFRNQVLADEVGGQFLAGYHTSSSSLSWIFIHLGRHQGIQAKLRGKLYSAYSSAYAEKRDPTFAELSNTRVAYLDAVMDEVLRLQATVLSRTATRDTQLLGSHIPKGTTVYMLCNGPGFHQPSFAQASDLRSKYHSEDSYLANEWDETRNMAVFDPDRWLREKDATSTTASTDEQDLEYNPNAAPQAAFGMGLRGCWGRRLAYVELRIVLTLVLWHFDFLEVSHELAHPSATLSVIHRSDACYVRLRERGDVAGR